MAARWPEQKISEENDMIFYQIIYDLNQRLSDFYNQLLYIKYLMLTKNSIDILELINLGFTLLFIIVYIYRLIRLQHFAISQLYAKSYPKTRIIMCVTYTLISIAFFITSIIINVRQHSQNLEFWLIEGIGEIIDSIILMMQMYTLREQLRKQRPYTKLHLIYCIYLNIVTAARIVIIVIEVTTTQMEFTWLFFFYLAFQINAVLLLGYWLAKRQQLPTFDDHRYINSEYLSNNSKYTMNRNIQISYFKKMSEYFTYIRASVAIEKNKFRIILQVYDLQDAMPEVQKQNNNLQNNSAHLKTISDNIYSLETLKELYTLCGRFDIQEKLNFEGGPTFQFYKKLQTYLNALFENKKHYHEFVLKFFEIEETYLSLFHRQFRQTIKGSEFDLFAHLDKNAPLISIRVFKQLWIDDHYLFYIDLLAADGSFESRPMKRYNDFESFHHNLGQMIKKSPNNKLVLPHLPKKYLFNWDESKIIQRRIQLQKYLRNLTNDHNIMILCPQLRVYILAFLNCKSVSVIHSIQDQLKGYYNHIEILKGDITKSLIHNQYVTFYEFKVFRNGLELKTIRKRFSQFVELHENIQREMNNSQIQYKFIVLPEKHLYKSDQHRYEKLKGYLQNITQMKNVWRIYAVNDFFGFGQAKSAQQFSSILEKSDHDGSRYENSSKNSQYGINSVNLLDENSVSSKNRMSAMIDQLGF